MSTSTTSKNTRYVGSLSPKVTPEMLVELCETHDFSGVSAHVVTDPITRKSRGYAYLNFTDADQATRAHAHLNYRPLEGQALRIMHVDRNRYKSSRQVKRNLFIKTLDPAITERQLYDTLTKYFGPVDSVRIIRDKRTSESRGRGFVQFESASHADVCFEKLQGLVVGEMAVVLERYQPKKRNNDQFTNTFVHDLPKETTNETLKAFFAKAGAVTSVKARMTDVEAGETPVCEGFGYVAFETPEGASAAVESLTGTKFTDLEGNVLSETPITVERFVPRQARQKQALERRRKCNLYVRNFPEDWAEEDLRAAFSQFGNIASARVMKRETGESQGFGFVCFNKPEETKAALEHFKNQEGDDSDKLFVAPAQTKGERNRQANNRNKAQQGGNLFTPHLPGFSPQQVQLLFMQFVRFVMQMGPVQGQPMNMAAMGQQMRVPNAQHTPAARVPEQQAAPQQQ